MTESRLISTAATREDEVLEASIRPKKLSEYLGQQAVREQLGIYIEAAKRRGEALDHCTDFFEATWSRQNDSLGMWSRTNLRRGEPAFDFIGPVIERAGDLGRVKLSRTCSRADVLFIDEIHRLSPVIEEILYPAMEDNQIDIMIGEGPAARSIKLDLPPFTLIGATTRAGLLTSPLRDRFGIVQRLEFYTPNELAAIVRRSAKILGIACADDGAQEIADRARGTPRIANRLLRRVRDFAEVKASGRITREVAVAAMQMLKVDAAGFRHARPASAQYDHRPFRRRPGRRRVARRGAVRGARHDRGRARAVFDPAGLPHAYRAWPHGHEQGVPPPRAGLPKTCSRHLEDLFDEARTN